MKMIKNKKVIKNVTFDFLLTSMIATGAKFTNARPCFNKKSQSNFGRGRVAYALHCATPFPQRCKTLIVGGIWIPSNTSFPEPTWTHTPKGISIEPAVFSKYRPTIGQIGL